MTLHHITINQTDVPYKLIRNAKTRRGKIYVRHDHIEVVAPKYMPMLMVKQMLKQHHNWIEERQSNLRQKFNQIDLHFPKKFITGEMLSLRGDVVPIAVSATSNKHPKVMIEQDAVHIHAPAHLVGAHRQDVLTEALMKALKKAAREDVEKAVERYSDKLGLYPKAIYIKDQKRCWGSCSSLGNININWRLIFTESQKLDYVVLHELCHLKYLDHSDKFWNLVKAHMEGYDEPRQWLRQYGVFLKDLI